jgi:transposase InsO family protein
MRIFNKFKGTRGFVSTYNHLLKLRNMDDSAIRKAKIITHVHKHGVASAMDAFSVGRSTIFRWKKQLNMSHGHIGVLSNKSRAPKKRRFRISNPVLESKIIELRTLYPSIGKTQIYHQIKYTVKTSESTVGRVLKDLKKQNRLPLRGQKPEKTKKNIDRKRRTKKVGFEIDTVVRYVDGVKWYFVNALNIEDRKGFSYATTSHSSGESSQIFKQIDMHIQHVQTDNGSEFLDHFHRYCEQHNIEHFFIYPRTPKQNAHIERFNRTLEEEFIRWQRQVMCDKDNLTLLRQKLNEYMLYYNNTRPHTSLAFLPPVVYARKQLESHM